MLPESESPAALAGANGANADVHGECPENVAGTVRFRKAGPAQLFSLRPDLACAFRRKSELARLASFRRQHGVDVGAREAWARLIAEAAAQRGHDPDLDDFERIARSIVIAIDPDLAAEKLHAVCRERKRLGAAWRPVGAERAATALQVTAEERWACSITTIGAIDESKSERAARLADERRERDRLRKRLARAEAKKARAERIAREVDAAQCQKASTLLKRETLPEGRRDLALRPWEAEGMSRRTWFRRRAAGREAARQAEAELAALSESDLPSQKFEGDLTDRGPCQPAAALVTATCGYVCDHDDADLVLRRAARLALGWMPERREGEAALAFCRRRDELDRSIVTAVGAHRWRAMAVAVLTGRLSHRTLEAVLDSAGLSRSLRSIAA